MKDLMKLEGREVVFTDAIYKNENYDTIPFDPGMRGVVIKVKERQNICSQYEITIDFNEHVLHNKTVATKSWPSEEGPRSKFWDETEFYPATKISKITIYQDILPFKLYREVSTEEVV